MPPPAATKSPFTSSATKSPSTSSAMRRTRVSRNSAALKILRKSASAKRRLRRPLRRYPQTCRPTKWRETRRTRECRYINSGHFDLRGKMHNMEKVDEQALLFMQKSVQANRIKPDQSEHHRGGAQTRRPPQRPGWQSQEHTAKAKWGAKTTARKLEEKTETEEGKTAKKKYTELVAGKCVYKGQKLQ